MSSLWKPKVTCPDCGYEAKELQTHRGRAKCQRRQQNQAVQKQAEQESEQKAQAQPEHLADPLQSSSPVAAIDGGDTMASTIQSNNSLNNLPSAYANFLHQFAEMKLKNMQNAFLAGDDLSPYLETNFPGGGPRTDGTDFPSRIQALAGLTIALCWSLAAPEILRPVQTNNVGAGAADSAWQRSGWPEQYAAAFPPLDNVLQGECRELAGWMKDWKGSSEHWAKIENSLSISPKELTCSKHGISVFGHADFGLKRVGTQSSSIQVTFGRYNCVVVFQWAPKLVDFNFDLKVCWEFTMSRFRTSCHFICLSQFTFLHYGSCTLTQKSYSFVMRLFILPC
jgi:hypothetical protein